MQWAYAPGALTLAVTSDADLNLVDGARHALSLCVYQLTALDQFRQLSMTPDGLTKLNECENFDKAVVGVQRIIVQPARDQEVVMDRMENARFIGLAAGYYNPIPAQSARVFEIPVDVNAEGSLWWKKNLYQPGKLTLSIKLGAEGLMTKGVDQP